MIFARLSQHPGKDIARKILELVNEEIESQGALLRVGSFWPWQPTGIVWPRGNEQVRFVMTKLSFGEVGDEQALMLHDERECSLWLSPGPGCCEPRIEQELTELVLDGSDGFSLESAGRTRYTHRPKTSE